MDVFTYADERQRECTELSLDGSAIRAAEEKGSDGQRGRLLGAAYMSDDAYIAVHEVVVIEGEHVHRERYAYFLVVEDEEIGGYERHPTHEPPEHRHCSHAHGGHKPGGDPSGPISFKDAAREAWEWLSLHPPEPDPTA